MPVRRTDPIAPLPQDFPEGKHYPGGGFCSYLPIGNELRLAEAWLLVRWGKGHLQIIKVKRAPLLGGPSFLYCVCNWEWR